LGAYILPLRPRGSDIYAAASTAPDFAKRPAGHRPDPRPWIGDQSQPTGAAADRYIVDIRPQSRYILRLVRNPNENGCNRLMPPFLRVQARRQRHGSSCPFLCPSRIGQWPMGVEPHRTDTVSLGRGCVASMYCLPWKLLVHLFVICTPLVMTKEVTGEDGTIRRCAQ